MPSLVVEGERDMRCRPTKCACTNPSRRTDLRDQRSGSLVVKSPPTREKPAPQDRRSPRNPRGSAAAATLAAVWLINRRK